MDAHKQLVHRSSGTTEPVQQQGPYQIEPLLTEAQEAAAKAAAKEAAKAEKLAA